MAYQEETSPAILPLSPSLRYEGQPYGIYLEMVNS